MNGEAFSMGGASPEHNMTEIRSGALELASLGVSLDVGALWIDLDWLAQP